MKTSSYHYKTLKDSPSDAELISHKLMLRSSMIKLNASGLTPFFQKIITSEKVNVKKPDPKIFDYALNLVGAKSKNTIILYKQNEYFEPIVLRTLLGVYEQGGLKETLVDIFNFTKILNTKKIEFSEKNKLLQKCIVQLDIDPN